MKAAKRTEKEIIMADDPLSDLSMKPSRDDMVSRQQGQPRSRRHTVDTAGNKPRSMAPWLILLLLTVAGASGAGGWYLWQQIEALQARLVQSTSLLEESQSRLGHLQSNIESQSQNLSQSGTKVESELDVQMSEIRKLWDVAYKRNKPDIEKNTQNIAELSKAIASQKGSVKQVGDALAKAEASLAQLQNKYSSTDKVTKSMVAQIDQLSAQLKELSVQNETIKSMVNVQDSQIKRLSDTTGSKMEQRLSDLEIAIKAIDAHRRQVNSRLDSFDQAFRQQQSAP